MLQAYQLKSNVYGYFWIISSYIEISLDNVNMICDDLVNSIKIQNEFTDI